MGALVCLAGEPLRIQRPGTVVHGAANALLIQQVAHQLGVVACPEFGQRAHDLAVPAFELR